MKYPIPSSSVYTIPTQEILRGDEYLVPVVFFPENWHDEHEYYVRTCDWEHMQTYKADYVLVCSGRLGLCVLTSRRMTCLHVPTFGRVVGPRVPTSGTCVVQPPPPPPPLCIFERLAGMTPPPPPPVSLSAAVATA